MNYYLSLKFFGLLQNGLPSITLALKDAVFATWTLVAIATPKSASFMTPSFVINKFGPFVQIKSHLFNGF